MTDFFSDISKSRKKVFEIIKNVVEEVAEESEFSLSEKVTGDTKIFGGDSPFDSIALTNIIVQVEEGLDDVFDVDITIADEKAMSQSASPFRTVNTLIDYIIKHIGSEISENKKEED